jgi:hypothetical protein
MILSVKRQPKLVKTISAHIEGDFSFFCPQKDVLLVTPSHQIMNYYHSTVGDCFEIIFERPDAEFRGTSKFLFI